MRIIFYFFGKNLKIFSSVKKNNLKFVLLLGKIGCKISQCNYESELQRNLLMWDD